jgi:hypothetical protein
MNLWKQIRRGNAARAARGRPHQTQPGLEVMESRGPNGLTRNILLTKIA